jgi:molybdopterin molybdotransferase
MSRKLPTLEEAWEEIADRLAPLAEEEIERRAALGRVLTRSLAATGDQPGEDVSAMDGYALAGAAKPGESRPVAATVVAGDPPGCRLASGAAARIMTGAPVPLGADRVIPVEATDGGRDRVTFQAAAGPWENIRRRGEVLAAGDELLPAGATLTPGALSLAASHGYASLPVHRAPTVAVLATGDEVVPPETEPAPGQLRDSHTDFLLAAGTGLGLSFVALGIAPDRRDALASLVECGLAFDVLLLCGGVSMGELDLVEGVLADLGCRTVFDGVAVQPGKPMVFAVHDGGLVFGLPGNPASAMVTFWLFVAPALRRLTGHAAAVWSGALSGILREPLAKGTSRDRFLPAAAIPEAGRLLVTPFPPKGSHDLAAYGRGNALLRIRPEAPAAAAGSACEVLLLGGLDRQRTSRGPSP